MVDQHGSHAASVRPLCDGAGSRSINRADGKPVDRQRVNDWIARQSLPLHRIPPDRRRGAQRLLCACQRLVLDRGAGRRRALTALKDDQDVFVRHQGALFAAPATLSRLPSSITPIRTPPLVGGSTGCRTVGHQAVARSAQGDLARPRQGLDEIEDRQDAVSFGAMVTHTEAMPLSCGDRSRSWGIDAALSPARRCAWRDRRRQHRERLARSATCRPH